MYSKITIGLNAYLQSLLNEFKTAIFVIFAALLHLRNIISVGLGTLILATALAPSSAMAASASMGITLIILPAPPSVNFVDVEAADNTLPIQVVGAEVARNSNGDYIVQPLGVAPTGQPSQSLEVELDRSALPVNGILQLYIIPQ